MSSIALTMKAPFLASGPILITIVIAILSLSSVALADPDFSTVEERMTGQEFRNTGLYKLTDEELAELNRWIRQRSLADGQTMSDTGSSAVVSGGEAIDRRGLQDSTGSDQPIRSRIIGTFTGWEGDTVFELENGMVWEQIDNKSFASREMENPEVEIHPGFFGSWRIQVEGYNTRAQVRRIR